MRGNARHSQAHPHPSCRCTCSHVFSCDTTRIRNLRAEDFGHLPVLPVTMPIEGQSLTDLVSPVGVCLLVCLEAELNSSFRALQKHLRAERGSETHLLYESQGTAEFNMLSTDLNTTGGIP